MAERQAHPIAPVFDEMSRILILGSFPSVKSREAGFFYGHPQNRFWRVLAAVLGCPVPATIDEKRNMLLAHHVAVWDVIASCEITGSSDSSIRNVVPTDLGRLLADAPISAIFCNGGTALRLYQKYQQNSTGIPAAGLPSTSPANAAWTLNRLVSVWNVIRTELEK
ncbi:MAG: DNA-deoxyinosine glycosylase [Clostridia bacterium]|nr:MAG: DNA-deoxyinosine glycosylase [Clostridia bacterium]